MKIQSAVLAMVVAFGMIAAACASGSGGASGTGGSSSSAGAVGAGGSFASGGVVGAGGSSSGGAAASCSNVTACGGSVVGTWNVTSSCLKVSGQLDLSLVGAGCSTAPVTGSLTVSGTWTANSDGTYTDNTMTSGDEQFTLAPSCLVISSTQTDCPGAANIISSLGYSSVTCTAATGGGCACSATVKQSGGAGVVSNIASPNGNYAPTGNLITIDNQTPYSYCASGSTMTWTPQTTSPVTTGSIAFQKSDGAGGTSAGGTSGMSAGGASAGGTSGMGAGGGAAAGGGSTTAPCDIYLSGGTPCVAAHSTVRALLGAYSGKLYQVRSSTGATKDILTLTPGGVADGASQDAFCSGTTCVITVVYDQSGKGNDLWYQGSTMVPASASSNPSKATSESLSVGGHKVYSLYINPNNSYWVDASKSGIALGKDPEGMYMVTSSKHYNSGCCFDYGNSETDRKADGAGAMDALNLSSTTAWGTGAGSGPWVMADLEFGLFASNSGKNQSDPTQTAPFVTAVLKNNGTTEFALRGSDATSGSLSTYYKGALPGGWNPMKKQGAIVLGSGGDCCKPSGGANQSDGTFYEGCIVTGYPTDATENAVQANIVAAGYSQ
jgi:non-reducing end alpha-L-arabinofuranosidase